MKFKTDEELDQIIENRVNGNISDFREAVKKLNSYDTARLISRGQPYHNMISAIELAWE